MTMGWAKIRQAAAYAGVSTRTMRDWLRMGLKYSRVRGCFLIRYSAIDDFIERYSASENEIETVVNDTLREFNLRR
jgi:excisionase family DNA binding protein